MPVSNASLEDEDCSDISDWVDADTGEAESTQIAFDGKSTFKFDSKTSADTNDDARREKDVGSIEGLGNRVVASLKVYCDEIGTRADLDWLSFHVFRSDWRLFVGFGSDGLRISDGDNVYVEVGDNLVIQKSWQEWTFDVDLSAGVANAVCDVYLDNILEASSVDCSRPETAATDGLVFFQQLGYATDNRVSYIDWIKVGDGFAPAVGWSGKMNGVTNPGKINGIAVADITKVCGVS